MAARRPLAIRAGKMRRLLLIGVAIVVGGAIGFGIGRLSTFANSTESIDPVPSPANTNREFHLPKFSDKIDASYRGMLTETAAGVQSVMRANPNDVNSVSALALLYYLAHDGAGEESCWKRCLELDPTNALAHSRLVALAQQHGNYQRIIELMQDVLKKQPDNATYRGMLASALMYLNRPAEAREQLEQTLRSGQGTVDTYMLLGEVFNQLNELNKAKRYLELAVDLSPQRLDALYSLFKVCTKLGESEPAKQHLELFQKLKAEQQAQEVTRVELQDELFIPPRVAEIETLIGKAYLSNRNLELAEKYFRQAAARSDKDLESRKMLAQLMTGASKFGEAIRWTKELRKLEPSNGLHYWNEGVLYTRAKLYADAERVFRDICQLEPSRDTGYASLAELYLQTNQKLDEARQMAERAIEISPTSRNHWLLASIAQKQRDYLTARAALERALEQEPRNDSLKKMYDSLPQK